MSLVRLQTDDSVSETPGLLCEQEANQTVDAPDGPHGDLSRAAYKSSASPTSCVPVFTAQSQCDPDEPSLVFGCDV